MIFQIDTTIDSSSFFSNLTILEWLGLIGSIASIIGIPIAFILYVIPAIKVIKEKKKNREKYFKHGGWIKATALKYIDLDKKRDKQIELNPTNHEALYKDILAFINSNPKTKNILLVGQSLSGKSHLTTRLINQLKNAYVLLPTHELLEKTDEIEKLFPKPPKKAKVKVLLVDDLQEYLAKGKHISETILHFINTKNCIVWFNYVKHGNSNDFGFKQLDSFKTFEIQKLGGDEIKDLKKHQTENTVYDSDGTIGSLFYPLEWMEKKYGELTLLSKDVISIIKQAYMLGFHDESFVMPYNIIYNYFKAEYEASNNTNTKLDETLDELATFSFIANTITHKSFVFEPVYLDKVVNPTLKYDDFVDNWDEKGLMNAENWFSVGIYYAIVKPNNIREIDAYLKTITINPDHFGAWNNLGIAYSNIEKMELAIDAYMMALRIKPDAHETLYNLGNECIKLQKYDIAINYFEQAVKIKPSKYQAWSNMGTSYKHLDKLEMTLKCYLRAVEEQPDSIIDWFNLSSFYFNTNSFYNAINANQTIININQKDPYAWHNMGLAYEELGDVIKAKECFDKHDEILEELEKNK